MQFSRVLDSMVRSGDEWRVEVEGSWLQGRSLYGGLQAGIAVRAMRSIIPSDLPLRALQVTFVSPVAAGTVRAVARILRAGKNAIHVEARLLGAEGTAALVVGVFGASRASAVRVSPVRPVISSESTVEIPFSPGLSPSFIQHFAIKPLRGALPFTASSSRELVMEVSLRDDGPTVPEHVLAIADAPPPIALSHLDAPAFGSSMTWTLEMLRESVSDLPLRGFRLDAELVAAENGYTSQSVMVWAEGGEPVALSRQSMVVFG